MGHAVLTNSPALDGAEIAPTAETEFRAAVGRSDFKAAAELLYEVIWRPDEPGAKRLSCLSAFVEACMDDGIVEALLLRLLEREPECPAILIHIAALDLRHQRGSRALERLEQAEASAPLPRHAVRLRIKALRSVSEWDEVFGRSLARALKATPEVRGLYRLKSEFHAKRGEGEAARAILEEACRRFPEDTWFALQGFRLHLSNGDSERAAPLLTGRIWPSALPEEIRRGALGHLVRAWKDPKTLQAVLEALLRGAPDDRFVLVKLASLATRQRRRLDALLHLEQAEKLGPLPPEAQAMRISLLVFRGDPEAALVLARQLHAASPERKDLLRQLNLVAAITGRQDDATQTMRRSLEQWPTDASVVQRYNRLGLPEREDREYFERVLSFSRANSVDGRWHYQFAVACLRRKQTPRAVATLRNLSDDASVAFEARRLLGMLETLPADEWDTRARLSNDGSKDMQVIRVPSAKATIVLMAGLHGMLGNLPFSHVDALLQQHPVNVIYLRDNRWSAFTEGLPSLGPDEASTVSALASLCADLGVPTITLGGSLGGWSAVRYGALLRAQVSISLAGPTWYSPEKDRPKNIAQHFLIRIMKGRDLLRLLGDSPTLQVVYVYGARHAKDAARAAQLGQLANVTLIPIDDLENHLVIAGLVSNGGFHPLISRAIAMAQTSASG